MHHGQIRRKRKTRKDAKQIHFMKSGEGISKSRGDKKIPEIAKIEGND